MFTGIIEELGTVRAVRPRQNGLEIEIEAQKVRAGLGVGASVAVDGVCQTVLQTGNGWFQVASETETLRVTTLGRLGPGSRVNLERALAFGGRLDGHLVLGHVDERGRVVDSRQVGGTRVLEIEAPGGLRPYIAPKGCIAVDGVSLTVGPWVRGGRFEVYLIPHTWEMTTLRERDPGAEVNLEADVLARYVLHGLQGGDDVAAARTRWQQLLTAFGDSPGGAR